MQDILTQIKQAFTAAGGKNIYTAFDAVPIRDKGEFFTVLSIGGYEAMPPIYTNNKIYMPVKAELTVTVLAPEKCSQEEIYDYYSLYFEASVNKLCGLSSTLKKIDVSIDKALNRLALKSVVKLNCMKIITKTEEAAAND
ncbi:MAG: hypothetical protein J6B75_04845 [Ruminococcus sp.]|nr:hypothetical protein [Ruminococcus sp.]